MTFYPHIEYLLPTYNILRFTVEFDEKSTYLLIIRQELTFLGHLVFLRIHHESMSGHSSSSSAAELPPRHRRPASLKTTLG